jgi:hypothetical protein
VKEALSILAPTDDESSLLAACLHRDERARAGWARWLAVRNGSDEDLCRQLAGTRTLLPLLAAAGPRHRLPLGRGVLDYLRATVLREHLRSVRFRQIAAEALSALARRDVTVFVLRGAALAATVYDDWSHRHCHDLDLLIAPEELDDGARALTAAGFDSIGRPSDPRFGRAVEHASGLQVHLHTRPFAIPHYAGPPERFTAGATSITVEDVTARAPSREATLVYVLGHASYSPSRRNLRWVADAWQLLAAESGIDWDGVIETIVAHRLALPLSVLLEYIADFGMPVPPEAVLTVQRYARSASRVDRDVALGSLRSGPRGDLGSVWRSTRSWRERGALIRWILAPSPGYMRSAFPTLGGWLLPLCYPYRAARFVGTGIVSRTFASAGRG